ncbi:MAG: amino acid ABC transporter permease [Thermoprotei archaeon]|nr:MAG: amino acid ABC transporter permease [Thermoprotei archaeon]
MLDTLFFIASIIPFLIQGISVTLQVTLFAFAIGLALASLLTPIRVFAPVLLSWLPRTYVELFRGTPLLVQLFLIYFGLPSKGIKLDALTAGILALGLNSAAYQAEIFRASIKGIPESQFLAAESLGMSRLQVYRYVVFPQAFRIALPALVNEFVTLMKESSLVAIIGVAELTRRGEYLVAYTFRALEVYIAVAMLYLVLCLTFSQGAKIIEKKLKIPGYERSS